MLVHTKAFHTVAQHVAFFHAGHGGPNAADFVRQNLFDSLLKNNKFTSDLGTALGGAHHLIAPPAMPALLLCIMQLVTSCHDPMRSSQSGHCGLNT